jgi:hypothetical protein
MIQNGLEAATTKTACGLPRPTTVRLYQAKNGIRTSIVQLTTSVNKAVGKGAQFGANMTPPALKAPPLMNARATNGQIIQRSGPRGTGTLQINNMSGMDAVVVITPSDPEQAGDVDLREQLYRSRRDPRRQLLGLLQSGTGWDFVSRQFTESCSFSKYGRA